VLSWSRVRAAYLLVINGPPVSFLIAAATFLFSHDGRLAVNYGQVSDYASDSSGRLPDPARMLEISEEKPS
jgi:hypothetical protein